ncbi:GGDEF domain-containing protein [Pseudoxanthomonas broegbernensis]|nr:GGDEF domain-containing protein [Pseudoxanthomonas broegbernensis]MBB6065347.1 diguanylate cyclase (GGDEF)-like protein [Pseudoxanthomonas broegbernensis]
MTTDFYHLLLSDCVLALILLGLFAYVARVARGVHGIASWGVGHYLFSLGAAMLDGSAQALDRQAAGDFSAAIAAAGSAMACAGLAVMAGAVIKFAGRRSLHAHERALLALLLLLPLAAWLHGDPLRSQGAAMSAVELVLLGVMLFQLRRLDTPPARLPARLMLAGSLVLGALYGRDLVHALGGHYGANEAWVNIDLSMWFLFNFCMLMLASFRAAEALQASAMEDPLTGTLNRRGLYARLEPQLQQLDRGASMAVIALDVDHFKRINDGHGHDIGDLVLQRLSEAVRACIRETDLFARMGGEEFLVVLTGPESCGAAQLAERIRGAVEDMRMAAPAPDGLLVTASFGVCLDTAAADLAELQRRADEALYAAKRGGRNRVVLHAGEQPAMA